MDGRLGELIFRCGVFCGLGGVDLEGIKSCKRSNRRKVEGLSTQLKTRYYPLQLPVSVFELHLFLEQGGLDYVADACVLPARPNV